MQFIKDLPPLNTEVLDNIFELVRQDTQPFKPSLLYEVASKEKILDTTERVSEFKLIRTPELFSMVESYIQKLNELENENDTNLEFTLLRNDVTHIKYRKGGFFKPHEDYLSFTSNILQEYTMIICMDAECEGGETILHLNKFFKHISKSTTTPYHSLLFRKDICHEGAILESGYKEIVTLNLLAVDKSKSNCEKLVIINFPKETNTLPYVLSLKDLKRIPGNRILSEIAILTEKSFAGTTLFQYNELEKTHKQFDLIYKLFQQFAILIKTWKKI